MFTNNFDPVAFQIFSLEIRWYSLAYIMGILIGWLYCKKILIKDKIVLNLFDDFITYVIVGVILGGRLGYVIIYNPNYYFFNLSEIFKIWNGGMSFHGGLIGVIVATFLFGKKYKVLFLLLFFLIKKNSLQRKGLVSAYFLIFYSLFRFFVEFFRNPDGQIGYLMFNLTLGQLISIVFFLIGLILYVLKK